MTWFDCRHHISFRPHPIVLGPALLLPAPRKTLWHQPRGAGPRHSRIDQFHVAYAT